jgi:D-alanine-D-alanine ligase
MMSRLKISLLRGGPSDEYEISLLSGQNALRNLTPDKYSIEEVFIDKGGVWHVSGVPIAPERALFGTSVAVNALHGAYGEDGQVQRLLDQLNVPYTGAKQLGAAQSFNKDTAKKHYKNNYLKTPHHQTLKVRDGEDLYKIALKIFREFPQPSVIKPIFGGSSKDIHFCSSFEDVYTAIDELSKKGEQFMVEEFIFGKEAAVGVVEDWRGNKISSLMPVEIEKEHPIFGYDNKYKGVNRNLYVPSRFSTEEKQMLDELAKEAHEALSLRHYSQSDFIISPRGIYILETNSLPGLTEQSLLVEALQAGGSNLGEFLDHIIVLATGRK